MSDTAATTPIRAALVREKDAPYEMADLELSAPQPQEVIVRIIACGICQTDSSVQKQGQKTPLPMVLGHEGAGVVERVGEAVTKVAPGDHVVLTIMSCGACTPCLKGEPAYCARMYPLNFLGQRMDGSNAVCDGSAHVHFFGQSSFATRAIAHERNVIKVNDDGLDLALLGPLGCGLQTGAGAVLNSVKVAPGSSVAVFGCGGVGLAAIMAAGIAGAIDIIAVDINAGRLALARELGATATVNPEVDGDPIKAVRKLTGGGANYTIETSGVAPVLEQAIRATAPRGTCAIVGLPATGTLASFDVNMVLSRGITLRGVVEGDSVPEVFIPQLVAYHRAGRFPIEKLVKFYDFEDINTAVADMKSGKTIKPILRIGEI